MPWCTGCGPRRDVVPESHDVHESETAGEAQRAAESYEHVAKRPLATIGLAEARGVPREVAAAAVEKLADDTQACATALLRSNKLARGAARVVAGISPEGAVLDNMNVRLSPGPRVAANAIECLIAPLKLLGFPPADPAAGRRAIAIEAAWGAEGRAP